MQDDMPPPPGKNPRRWTDPKDAQQYLSKDEGSPVTRESYASRADVQLVYAAALQPRYVHLNHT